MIEITGNFRSEYQRILTEGAQKFLEKLHSEFSKERSEVLNHRKIEQDRINEGNLPTILTGTPARTTDWKVREIPQDVLDRRVEITGPASNRKMVINALNSGAKVYMADAEDSECPTWDNIMKGQVNLYDAARMNISHEESGKKYELKSYKELATLMFRPRGWHLAENHVLVNGEPISASLFDFGVYFWHNSYKFTDSGSKVYLYLPKTESRLEAALWAKIFQFVENERRYKTGAIRVTALLETLPAAFEMEEILWELRDYALGLNCGRWDYIFSFIKKLRNHNKFVLPDRSLLTMDKSFLTAYSELLIQTCHRHGAFAMGGMAAQIPIKNNVEANVVALAKVRADKAREVKAGHDGTWVAHPGLVQVACDVFDEGMKGQNQLELMREDVKVTSEDLLKIPEGEITEAGLRSNIAVSLRYLATWLSGNGCVAINDLMEDAATAEISRAQVWQWLKHNRFSFGTVQVALIEEQGKIHLPMADEAAKLFWDMVTAEEFIEFLTLPAYNKLLELEKTKKEA